MEEQTNVKGMQVVLSPNECVSIFNQGVEKIVFNLGADVDEYKFLEYKYTPKDIIEDEYGGADSYSFINYPITLWIDDESDREVDVIVCDYFCLWEGKELIGMDYDLFLDFFQLSPDNYDRIYSDGPKKNGRIYDVYDFDKLGLMVWVWRKKIRCVLISKYNPDDEIPFDKKGV